jgi:hypothetical protein
MVYRFVGEPLTFAQRIARVATPSLPAISPHASSGAESRACATMRSRRA